MSGYGGADDEQINAQAFIDNYIDLARSKIPKGISALNCIECGDHINDRRRIALPGVKTCIQCQIDIDKIKIKIKTVTYML